MILNLVNFAVTPYVSREGVLFETSEHNYQYLKAVYFQDYNTAAIQSCRKNIMLLVRISFVF